MLTNFFGIETRPKTNLPAETISIQYIPSTRFSSNSTNTLPTLTMSHSQITDPDSYSLRDILLLSQLLHTNKIPTLQALESINHNVLESVLHQWKTHVSTQLEHKTIKINTLHQLMELYRKLLDKYKVDNTESLANEVYYLRIDELKNTIETKRNEFTAVLNS